MGVVVEGDGNVGDELCEQRERVDAALWDLIELELASACELGIMKVNNLSVVV